MAFLNLFVLLRKDEEHARRAAVQSTQLWPGLGRCWRKRAPQVTIHSAYASVWHSLLPCHPLCSSHAPTTFPRSNSLLSPAGPLC